MISNNNDVQNIVWNVDFSRTKNDEMATENMFLNNPSCICLQNVCFYDGNLEHWM